MKEFDCYSIVRVHQVLIHMNHYLTLEYTIIMVIHQRPLIRHPRYLLNQQPIDIIHRSSANEQKQLHDATSYWIIHVQDGDHDS
jgi:hypothetical protein